MRFLLRYNNQDIITKFAKLSVIFVLTIVAFTSCIVILTDDVFLGNLKDIEFIKYDDRKQNSAGEGIVEDPLGF